MVSVTGRQLIRQATKRRPLAIGAILLAAVVLASCGSVGAATISSTSIVPATTTTIAPERSQVTVAASVLPTNFNPNTPAGNNSVTRQIMTNVWPSVFYVNSKFQPVLNSSLVSSAELVSTKPQKVIYRINPQAHWADGTPISASDFIYNWMAQSGDSGIQDLGGSPFLANSTVGYRDIKSVTGSNNGKTVTVVFKSLFSEWEHLFNPLVPAQVAKAVGWNVGFTQPSPAIEVSGGPYEISNYIPGKELELVRNPNYWGRKATIGKIVFLDDPNPSNYPNQLSDGTVNVVYTPAHDLLYSSLSQLPNVKTLVVPSLTVETLIFNVAKTPLSDAKVRQAIALALDRNAIISDAIGSYDPRARPAGNNIYPQGLPEYQNNGTKYETPNPSAAVALLTSDGYSRSQLGVMTKNGQPLVLSISVDNSDQQLLDVENLIVQQLSNIGIVVNPVNYSEGTLMGSVLSGGNFDMAIVSQPGSSNATYYAGRYLSSGLGSLDNYSRYSNPQADALIAKASTELDPGTSAAEYNQLDQLIWNDLPSLPLYSVPQILAYTSGYHFIGASGRSSTIFWDSSTWTFIPRQ